MRYENHLLILFKTDNRRIKIIETKDNTIVRLSELEATVLLKSNIFLQKALDQAHSIKDLS